MTCIRLILEVIVRSNSLNVAGWGAFGVMVNSTRTLVDVILDLFDYYLHQNWAIKPANSVNDPAGNTTFRYDLHTGRTLRGGERALDFVITNNAAGASAIVWTVNARMLLRG